MVNIDGLTTETVNEATKHIDEIDALGIVTLINQEDKKVAEGHREGASQRGEGGGRCGGAL